MNLKPILRYQLGETRKVFVTFYGTIYALLIIGIISTYNSPSSIGSVSGTEVATMIACFIVGISLFKSSFRFFTSFSITRKRLFCGLLTGAAVTATAVSLIDTINFAIFSRFMAYRTVYSSIAAGFTLNSENSAAQAIAPTPSLLFRNWLWCLLADFCIALLGLLIGALYFRMSKPVKILVSVGVPAVYFLILPLIDSKLTHGAIGNFVGAACAQWLLLSWNPGLDLLSRLVMAALLSGGIWLLLRRAELKT